MKRKKKILFDVLDGVYKPTPTTRSQPSKGPAEKKPAKARPSRSATVAGTGEIRLSSGLAVTLGFVFVLITGCAYYFGLVHGRSESEGDSGSQKIRAAAMRRDARTRDEIGRHWAVRAIARDYHSEASYRALADQMREYSSLLKDEGYEDLDLWDHADPEAEGYAGTLIIWVGRADREEELDNLADGIRALDFRGERPFETAYKALFKSRP